MSFKIILKVTKKQSFTLFLQNTCFKKSKVGWVGQFKLPSVKVKVRVKVLKQFMIFLTSVLLK